MASEHGVVVDALPYFDKGYDEPGVKEAALALVDEETRRYRPTKNYLDYLTTPNYSAFEVTFVREMKDDYLFIVCLLIIIFIFHQVKLDIRGSWVGLVSKNYEIERALVELELEVQELERQTEEEKRKR
ncbi:pre-mRNA-splicing factor SPF27-like [Lingula anatina]|uniref:Pre-mRNA-splicing factor SPF27 n=1 Tax=Lingula anatina TaxID=7574 RepID=A0A1S3HM11_LINAN|nr:pre-mRNA-splicing factor SPF27-like [Lingula anatina]|eukprot:XP_013387057.1 pre-mRNA-splicing factor SPF27-like [Lingula anatina]